MKIYFVAIEPHNIEFERAVNENILGSHRSPPDQEREREREMNVLLSFYDLTISPIPFRKMTWEMIKNENLSCHMVRVTKSGTGPDKG